MKIKKIILLVLFFGTMAYSASAQFHIELGVNFNSPQGDFGDSYNLGAGVYIEPKYAFNENLDLGLYLGSNGFVGADIANGVSLEATTLTPILATGTYRFPTNKVTPYAGLGLGMYIAKAVDFIFVDPTTGVSITTLGESSSEFGFAPRAGVYIGRLNLGLAYKLVSDANFIQINLGIRILSRE
jgi:outer membrane protein X